MEWIVLIQNYTVNQVTSDSSKGRYKYPPLGLLYISSILRLHGYIVHIVDMLSLDNKGRQIINRLKKLEKKYGCPPQLIGFTVVTENAEDTIYFSGKLQQIFPESLTICGGAHAKAAYEHILAKDGADIVSLVEGEAHIIEILKYTEGLIPINGIRGIAYKKEGEIIYQNRFYIEDLDILPLADFLNINFKRYRDVALIVSSRGCPGKCIFCASQQFAGRKYRVHNAERIFAEINFFRISFNIVALGFMDDTFTALKRRTKKLCEYLQEYKKKHILIFAAKSRVDFINDEILGYLKKSNCDSIHIGVESTDNHVLKIMKKHTTHEQNLAAIEKMVRFGMKPECSFIIGMPGDTKETIYKTVLMSHLISINFGEMNGVFGFATPYPGTELANNAAAYGIKMKNTNWRRFDTNTPLFETNSFSLEFLAEVRMRFDSDKDAFISEILQENQSLQTFYKDLETFMSKTLSQYSGKRSQNENTQTS